MSGQVSTDFSRDQLKAMLGSQDPKAPIINNMMILLAILLCHQITSALAAITVLKQFAHPMVLATAVTNRSWEDYLCQTYCNPAPANNVAPNLVIVEYDSNGQPYGHQAFNTQVCEQLNAWLGGYQSIAKQMTPGNFNWFIHVMLFYHTKYTIKKQQKKQSNQETEDGDIGLDEETETEEEEGSDEE
ncbi:hypothetical protein CPB84DRAFT_1871141 [Gymnopilus junonius]|uniref:Uncharacterized protein n=1 Tax=Gymnopilus junonius TaxID=109634 RepID=A0A9P5NEB8_GYMJU|nr:hypothetical protein CPB84DRAFT_1871141 [Gymnopilus junonius]